MSKDARSAAVTSSPLPRSRATRSVPSIPADPVTNQRTVQDLLARPSDQTVRTLSAVEIRQLGIDGAFEITPRVHGDRRGAFLEWFRADRFREATGHGLTLGQANCSVSAAGTVRGIHFADVPPGQAKYVTCVSGALLDVVVDVRVGSPTFGAWEGVLLADDNHKASYIGEGLGHAFMALADQTVVQYLCSTPYAPEREHGVHPLDPDIAIDWP